MRGFIIAPVEPIGHADTGGFVTREDSCRFEALRLPVYPLSPRGEQLQAKRVELDLRLGVAARLLGISPADLSGLENGRKTFVDPLDWNRAVDLWRAHKGELP